ncbi:unnamed protein product [Mytilus edulis]|uniref:VWFA domain-containing protein n=1 Tax=Mytilus edulis TaxID=6550 RepID=A0A8S3PVR5_MYTED|nr:unnamed protein product [Mytilus edulis]
MLKLGVLTFFVVCFVNGQLTDKTRTPNASGSDVVEAVVNLIREACIFPNDKLYLRRLAYVESMDGLEANTYRPNYYGGIWQIDQDMFQQIATAKVLDDAKKMIKQSIGIDWSKVQWADLAKPLYSGLAASLFTLLKAGNNGIPRGIEYQANFWVNTSRPGQLANVFFTKSNKLETGCKRTNALDLVFALDSSTSLAPQDFDVAKQFVKSIVDSFEISSDKTQVGVIRFSTTVDGGFNLNQHTSADGLKKAIDGVQYKSGGTHTAEAIEFAIKNLFTTTNGARLGSSKILILVTDGRSENGIETLKQAAAAKAKGISIFAIGVTAQVVERELNAVASQPTCTHVQILNSFADLDSLKAEIEQVSCKAPAVLTPNKYVYGCNSDVAVQILPNVKAGTTVTVMVDEGQVNVYGSLATSNPNAIINDFNSLATLSASTSFFIKGDKAVSLAFVSNKAVSCKTNFTVNVEQGMMAHKNVHLLCIEDNIIQNCTAETLQKSPYLILPPGRNNYLGLCNAIPEFFVFPERNDRFIFCDGQGHYFIVLCPLDSIFDSNVLRCIPGKLLLTPITTTSMPLTSTLTPVPTTAVPTGVVVPTGTPKNPCTPQNLALGLYFFEYPGNKQLFIECYNLPYVAVVKSCDVHHYWDQRTLTCLYRQVVVDPTKGVYSGGSNPCNTIPNLFYYPLPEKTKYIHCDDFGDAFEKTCPNNFIWSQPILQCIPRGVIFSAPPPVVGK